MEIKSNSHIPAKLILGLLLLASAGLVVAKVYPRYQAPCGQPIGYSLGTMDSRFNLSQDDLLSALNEAETIWETAAKKELFTHVPVDGKLKINLKYDSRQEATDSLKSLGYKIENTQTSYNSLNTRYESLVAEYYQRKSALDIKISQYESRKKAYEAQVEKWNKQGGAPKTEAAKLEAEYKNLNTLADQINAEKDALNELVNEVNALVGILNNLASQLKLNVTDYNTLGQSRGPEFEEGLYIKDQNGISINIYEFSTKDQLVRLLAHELGHALGLDHVEDSEAIMYRLNQAQNGILTKADLAELNRVCSLAL